MERLAFSNLRVRLSLLVALALTPFLGLILYSDFEEREQAKENIEATTMDLAQATVIQEEQILEGARQLLIGVAAMPELETLDSEACAPRMASLLEKLPGYSIVGAINPRGEIFCSSSEPVSTFTNVSDRLYFSDAVRTAQSASAAFRSAA